MAKVETRHLDRDPLLQAEDRRSLFKALIHSFWTTEPEAFTSLLFAGNRALTNECLSTAFSDVEVEVPLPGCEVVPGKVESFPARTARRRVLRLVSDSSLTIRVNRLHFHHPTRLTAAQHIHQDTFALSENGQNEELERERSEIWEFAAGLVRQCGHLEELVWETALGVGGDLWEAVSQQGSLRRLVIIPPPLHPTLDAAGSRNLPRITPELQCIRGELDLQIRDDDGATPTARRAICGGDGLGLGTGWDGLEELTLSGLSQAGARVVATHLELLAEHESAWERHLRSFSLSTPFLDSTLCGAVATLGALGHLTHLELATSGTKFTGECLRTIVEECTGLVSLRLRDIEGRLDKDAWVGIDWPQSVRRLEIDIPESGSHHSWVLQHLSSLHHIPVSQLSHLAIRRISHPLVELPFPPPQVAVPPVQPSHDATLLSDQFLDSVLENGASLEELCLDCWDLEACKLEGLLKTLPRLRCLGLSVRESILKLITMNPAFSASTSLERLVVTSRPEYNLATSSAKCKSPAEHSNAHDIDALPAALARCMTEPDGTIPDSRELRKFVRRLPALHTIEWIGRGGKGVWQFDRQGTKVNVRFTHSAVRTARVWEEAQRTPPSLTFVEPELRVRSGILTRGDEIPTSPTCTSGMISRIPSGSFRSPDLADSFPTLAEANSRRSGPTATSRAKASPQTRSPGVITPGNSLRRQRSASDSTAPSITIQTPKTLAPILKMSPAVPKGVATSQGQGDTKTKGPSSSQRATRSSGTEPQGKEKQVREQTSRKFAKNQATKGGPAEKEAPARVVPGAMPTETKDKETIKGNKPTANSQTKADPASGSSGGRGGWIKVGESTRKNKKK